MADGNVNTDPDLPSSEDPYSTFAAVMCEEGGGYIGGEMWD